MKYKEYTLFTDIDHLDDLIEKLTLIGCDQLVINDPREADVFKEGGERKSEWNYVDESVIKELEEGAKVSFFTKEDESLSFELDSFIKQYDFKVSISDDNDWLYKWEEYFVPTKLGQRTVVKPAWRDYKAKDDEVVVDIDPGLAFGTGSSPTTYLAIRLIEKYLKKGESVLDVGCGTGILSIVSAKLGASHVDAIDIDSEAISSTKKNLKLNNCEELVNVFQADLLKESNLKADFIEANLTADILLILFDNIGSHFNSNGIFITSGIIDDKEELIKEELTKCGFEILEELSDDCWRAFAARKI